MQTADREAVVAPVDVLSARLAIVTFGLFAATSLVLIGGINAGVNSLLWGHRDDVSFLWRWWLPALAVAALVYLLADGAVSWCRIDPAARRFVAMAGGVWLVVVAVATFGLALGTQPYSSLPNAFAVVVAVPVAEELVFRGALFRLAARIRPATPGHEWRSFPVVATSVLFALGHAQYWSFDLHAAVAARWYTPVFGLVMGVVRARSGSVRPGIAFHVSANLLSVVAGSL